MSTSGVFHNIDAKGGFTCAVHAGAQGAYVNKDATMLHGTLKAITQGHGVEGQALADFTHTTTNHLLTANAINEYAGTAAATCRLNLPAAKKGMCILLRFTGDLDAANALTIQTYVATDLFNKQVVGIPNGATASAVYTDGTHNEIVWTAAATNPQLGIGSEIWLFCPKDARWVVDVRAVPKGTGAVGVWTGATA